ALLTARIVLPTRTFVAGNPVQAKLIVLNESGRVIIVKTCRSPFRVELANDRYRPGLAWPLCLENVPIPIGLSTWMVDVHTTSLNCLGGNQPGEVGFPRCLVNGYPPSLPAGTYRATLYQHPDVVPDPEPIEVQVTMP